MNIVTSERQAYQIKKALGDAIPNLGVFVPKLAKDIFRLPTDEEVIKARDQFKVTQDCFHIVYAGRFIANKGIVQLIRALNLRPTSKIRLTLIGDFEDDFLIYQSNTTHTTFPYGYTIDLYFFPRTSKVAKGYCYIGFWRIAVWQEEKALVEFGYPGPLVKRFDKINWQQLSGCINFGINGEVEFRHKNENEIK